MNESETIWQLVVDYIDAVRNELTERGQKWPVDLDATEVHEVINGLMARQVTLAIQLAEAPSIWNGHVAPLLLRSMADCHISLAWIFENPGPRARMYVLHGLGQKKLWMEHFKESLKAKGSEKPEEHPVI